MPCAVVVGLSVVFFVVVASVVVGLSVVVVVFVVAASVCCCCCCVDDVALLDDCGVVEVAFTAVKLTEDGALFILRIAILLRLILRCVAASNSRSQCVSYYRFFSSRSSYSVQAQILTVSTMGPTAFLRCFAIV
uniref:Secreted peptide n=1 Tax=Syphacia muris TaxID=451379 RepID=A0A0N5ACZ4_9BILA